MDLLAALLQGASLLGFGLVLLQPRWGRTMALLAAATSALVLLHGVTGPSPRELTTTHTFVAYEGMATEPAAVAFPTGTVTAPGWQWPLPFVAFAALWGSLAWRAARRSEGTARRSGVEPAGAEPVGGNPWLLPLALGWTGTAVWLLQQLLAAPASVVAPVGLDRCLWPAGLALALRLAATTERLVPLLLQLALATTALRLPAALFSKVASDRGLGTSLDVSGIVDIVHPLTQLQFTPRLVAGSAEQQFWLIWAEQVLAFPAFHWLSFSGIAFAFWLMRRHANDPA